MATTELSAADLSEAELAPESDGSSHRWFSFKILAPLLIVAVAVVLRVINLAHSYDLFVDEPFYVQVGQSVAQGHLPYATGSRFFLHPPGFFLVEAGWIRIAHIRGNVFQVVYASRYLSVIFSAVSTLLIYLIGKLLAGRGAGAFAALAFALDPWVIRQSSMVLLDPAAMTWVLLGYLIIFRLPATGRRRLSGVLLAGLIFGMAILTKEFAAAVTLLPLMILGWRRWWLSRRECASAFGMALLPSVIWFVVIASTGNTDEWWSQISSGASRTVGSKQISGFNSPGAPSFIGTLIKNLYQFWVTYVIIGLGVIALAILLRSADKAGKVLATFGIGAVALLTYCIAIGTNEEQFLNYLYVPAVLALAVVVATHWRRASAALMRVAVLVATLAVLSNLANWAVIHSVADNGTQRMAEWMYAHVPAGTVVAVTNPVQREVLLRYPMVNDDSRRGMYSQSPRYLVVFERQVKQGYAFIGDTDLRVQLAGLQPAFTTSDRSNGKISVFRLPGS